MQSIFWALSAKGLGTFGKKRSKNNKRKSAVYLLPGKPMLEVNSETRYLEIRYE